MNFNPKHHRKVMSFISYLVSQSKSLKKMAKGERSYYDVAIALLAVYGMLNRLYPYFFFMLQDGVMDSANPLLDHPELDDETRSKVHNIRVSAQDMEIDKIALSIEELERIKKLLS